RTMEVNRLVSFLFLALALSPSPAQADEMPWVQVSKDKKGFVLDPSGRPFDPWGFNYDHDDQGRLIEDYWDDEWPAVEAHFGQMNEPVVPGGKRQDGDWLGPAFAGKHFVQFITLDQGDRERPAVARQWVRHLAAAIRKEDRRHLMTVGLVDWSLDRKGLTSGFV